MANAEITAVLVLYRQAPDQSAALRSFLACGSELLGGVSLLLYDNGPEDQRSKCPALPQVRYKHDPSNGQLYAAYSYALASAVAEGSPWLMLLDQDTALTSAYLAEALRLARGQDPQTTCALVPRLIVHGRERSPHPLDPPPHARKTTSPTEQQPLPSGRSPHPLAAWNSGALVSVPQLQSCGGFPPEFPLDNLDYALFSTLQQHGSPVYVMESRLEHELSVSDPRTLSLARLRGKLAADQRLQQRFGQKTKEQLAIEFFRTGVSLLRKVPDKRLGLACLTASVRCIAAKPIASA